MSCVRSKRNKSSDDSNSRYNWKASRHDDGREEAKGQDSSFEHEATEPLLGARNSNSLNNGTSASMEDGEGDELAYGRSRRAREEEGEGAGGGVST